MPHTKSVIGCIGQGYVGKSYADAIEAKGYPVIRYSLEQKYVANKQRMRECDIVFIAVPTPTSSLGFDGSMVESTLALLKKGATAVIKSTLIPGTTTKLQKKFPHLFVMHSPEFLVARTAAQDALSPKRSIIGIPKNTKAFKDRAQQAIEILPRAAFERVVSAEEAELIKYGGNFFLYLKVVFGNLLYEAAEAAGANYEAIREALGADPRIGPSHLQVVHDSGHRGAKKGRGAGGICFIKDVEAFKVFYAHEAKDKLGNAMLEATIAKNVDLLKRSGKDHDLLVQTYPKRAKKSKRA